MAKQEHWVSGRGCVYNVNYHLVWATKYRKPVLAGAVAQRLKALHKNIANKRGLIIQEEEVMPDHVHLFVTAHPKWSPSQLTKIFKGITAKVIFEEFPELKAQMWKGHLWNPSYYVGTVGDTTKDIIQRYIERQKVKR